MSDYNNHEFDLPGVAGSGIGDWTEDQLYDSASLPFRAGNAWDDLGVGRFLPAVVGGFGAARQARNLADLANMYRTDRAPFLNAADTWLKNPSSYTAGPATAGFSGAMTALNAKGGNAIGAPTAQQIIGESGARNWQDALTGMANLGLAGENTQATLGVAGANAGQG